MPVATVKAPSQPTTQRTGRAGRRAEGPDRRANARALVIRHAIPEDITGLRHVLTTCGLAGDRDLCIITGGVVLVAERDGQVVGMVQCLLGLPCAYIAYLAVLPEARANGRTAFRLITELEMILRSLGIPTWLANIATDDPTWASTVTRWGATPTPRSMTLHVKELTSSHG
jgi:N-acetylglutamate synthase-like GNAT family acetyltransferase